MAGKGFEFEKKVSKLLLDEIAAGRLGILPSSAAVFHRKGYHSKDREGEFVVDVSIEIYRPGATSASIIWVWECKNYGHSVSVDEAEEFYSKLSQIGGAKTKGTIITSGAKFQRGTIRYARSKGIGLVRLVPPVSSMSYVLECGLPLSAEEQQRELRRGLLAGVPASRESDYYTMTGRGVFADELGEFIEEEAEDLSLR